MNLHSLTEELDGLRLMSRSAIYIGIGAAATAVELFRRRSLVIVGLEGVRTDGIVIQALDQYIADFSELKGSWEEQVEGSAAAALRVLRDWHDGPEFVDFTLIAQSDTDSGE
jgi:hypothetical protein